MVIRKKSEKSATIAVLRQISKLISELGPEEIEAVARGEAKLSLIYPGHGNWPSSNESAYEENAWLDRIQAEFAEAASQDEGFAILDRARLTRADLVRLAKLVDIPVMKSDSVNRLQEKLIEALVGSRLNSKAVRGR